MNPALERIRILRSALASETAEQKSHHTVGEVFVLLQPVELGLGGIVFSIPFLQPVPLPGLSTPFGILLGALGFFHLSGQGYRALPKRLLERRIEAATVLKILEYSEKTLSGLAKIPFWNWGRAGRLLSHPRALGSHIVFMAILLSLPLPVPFSNALPAWGIVFASLSIIEANGIFILLSYLTLIGNLVFFGGLVLLAAAAV
ncbi:MAG: hypothetical protein EBR09_15860 [Proteobacteria bacterium]|nr:hypothetical protein [Pseudomonadota bacterium]